MSVRRVHDCGDDAVAIQSSYSHRRAVAGSTRVARTTGIPQPTRADRTRRDVMASATTGSAIEIPNRERPRNPQQTDRQHYSDKPSKSDDVRNPSGD